MKKVHETYFRQQKAVGVILIVLSLLAAIITQVGECLIFTALGIYMLVTKRMVITNEHYYEVQKAKEKRRQAYEAWKRES